MRALTFSSFGGPEVLEYATVPMPHVGTGYVLVRNAAIGLNYADIYRRRGNYHLKGKPPYIAGYEGAGVIVESNSHKYQTGERVGYADVPFSNAEYTAVPEQHVIPLPDDISFEMAAAILLQGLTAHYLATDSYRVQAGDIVLIHAAAGGVGQILTQYCKLAGAVVLGLSRDADKLSVIKSCGADFAVQLDVNWKASVMNITNGRGVDVVYDSVGSTLEDSFEVTKTCGHVVFYGMSGGDPKPVDPRMLMDTSKTLTGGDLWSYLQNEQERHSRANGLFELIIQKKIIINEPVKFALSEGRLAHEFLEGGKSASKVLLMPFH